MVMNSDWINTVSYTPLLRHTVLTPLLSEYVPDGVGISPATVHHMTITMATSQHQLQKQQAASATTASKSTKNCKFTCAHVPCTLYMRDYSNFVQQVIRVWLVWLGQSVSIL